VTVVPWNIIRYNIFGGSERGPDLFGTSPWSFYFLNLVLNFNILVPLSLLALPALAVTYAIDRKRLGFFTPTSDQSSPFMILGLRLLPFYLWLGILTFQAHKEERFMFPAYPMLCFNAAVTLYLMRGWQEAAFIKLTNSPYRASIIVVLMIYLLISIRNPGFTVVNISKLHIVCHRMYGGHLYLPYFGSSELLPCTHGGHSFLRNE
jgi:alpha-1,2-mannosyltransferase